MRQALHALSHHCNMLLPVPLMLVASLQVRDVSNESVPEVERNGFVF